MLPMKAQTIHEQNNNFFGGGGWVNFLYFPARKEKGIVLSFKAGTFQGHI